MYEGTDYIPGLYKSFIADLKSKAYILEIDGEVAGFQLSTVVNGGNTFLGQAGRMKAKYSGQGYYSRFGDICVNDMKHHFPNIKDVIGMRKISLNDVTSICDVMKLAGRITLVNTVMVLNMGDHLVKSHNRTSTTECCIGLVPDTKLPDILQKNKSILQNHVTLRYQPYEVTDANITYIAEHIRPVCFLSQRNEPDEMSGITEKKGCGVSFHTHMMCKVGLVVYMSYKGDDKNDFELHFHSHLQYIAKRLLTGMDQGFHMYIDFPINLRIGDVLHVAFQNGLKPGVRDEGILVIRQRTNKQRNHKVESKI